MKKFAFLIPLLVLPILVNAQKSPVDKLFDKYYGKEGFTTVLVTEDMFKVVANMEESSGDLDINSEGILGKIKRVRVIAQEGDSAATARVDFRKELKGMNYDDYKELVVVKEANQEVLVLAKEDGGKLSELLVLVGGEENVLVSVEGKFTMEDLQGLSALDGLDALDDVLQ